MTWSKEKRRRKEVKYSAVVGIATAAAKETDWETRLSSAVQCAVCKQQAVGPYKAIHRIDKRQRDSEQAESRCLEAPDAVALAFAARCRCDRGPTIGRWPHTKISSLFFSWLYCRYILFFSLLSTYLSLSFTFCFITAKRQRAFLFFLFCGCTDGLMAMAVMALLPPKSFYMWRQK